jgi:YVTN family beta-propeller protein
MNKKVDMFKLGIVLLISFAINIWAAKPTVKISASPTTIAIGGSSTLTWTSTGATSISINQGIGAVPVNGSRVVLPTVTTTYTITAKNSSGTATTTAKVTVTAALPTVSFSAAPVSISPGQSSTLSWTTTGATSVSINQGIGIVALNGSKVVTPAATKIYTITVKGSGGTVTAKATVTVVVAPPTVSLSAEPMTIQPGESSTLTWTTTNATSAIVDNDIGSVELSSSITVYPAISTTYTIIVSGAGGTISASTTITVNQPQPQVSLHAIPMAILPGESSILCWQTKNVDSTTIDNGIGSVPTSGSIQVSPTATTTYTITAIGLGGTATASTTVEIDETLQPSVSLYSSPKIVKGGRSIILSWNATHAESAEIDNGIGSVPIKGSLSITPTGTATFSVTVRNANGTATASVKVDVKSEPKCYSYIPSGLNNTVTIIDNKNASVVKTIPVGSDPSGCAVSPDGMRVYIGNNLSNSISVIDAGSNSVVSTMAVGVNPKYLALSPGGEYLYVANEYGYNIIEKVDTGTGQIAAELHVGGEYEYVQGMAFHPDGSRLYVAISCLLGSGKVLVIDTIANEVLHRIPVGITHDADCDLAVSADGSRLYWISGPADSNDNLFVIDTTTYAVLMNKMIPQSNGTPAQLADLVVLPDGGKLYLLAKDDSAWNPFSYIDTATFTFSRLGYSISYPKNIGVDPDGSRVFVLTSNSLNSFYTSSNTSGRGVSLYSGSVAYGNFIGYIADTVAGKVTNSGVGVAGITMTAVGEGITKTTQTDANGNYGIALENGTYTITPSNGSNVFSPQNVTVTVNQSLAGKIFAVIDTSIAPTVTLQASPVTIMAGSTAILSWTSTNAATAVIDNGVDNVPINGSITVTPTATTTYKITVSNTVLTGVATAKVTVIGTVPTVTIAAMPATIQAGGSSTLTWTSTNATSASLDNGIGTVPVNGSRVVTPAATTTFKITVTGTGGSVNASVTVSISEPPPTVTITASPDTIPPGGSSTLTWTAANATSVSIDQGIGNVQLNGSLAVTPAVETIYTITATGNGGTSTASVTVKMLDSLLRGVWNGMKTAMLAGNVNQIAAQFSDQTRAKYSEIFTAIADQLPQIAQEMMEIEPVYFEEFGAKFRIKRTEVIEGITYDITYYIYFVQEEDGSWKILNY